MNGGLISAYPLVRTNRIEELQEAFERVFVRPVLQPVGRDRAINALHNHCTLQRIGVSFGSYATGMRFQFPEPRDFLQIFPVSGHAGVTVHRQHVAVDSSRSAVISAGGGTFDIYTDEAYQRLGLIVESNALKATLAAMLGHPVQRPVTFEPLQDFSQPLARSLRTHFMFLVGQLNTGPFLPPLVLAELEQTLVTLFLHANRHAYSHLLEREHPSAALRQVRLAEESIESTWDKPFSLERLAAVTGLSIRSLYQTFTRKRGYSPIDFLRQVRLRRARAHLRERDPQLTEEEVSHAAGFRSVESFRAAYLRAFGERPEDTIKRGSGARRLH